jgi:hypothetical protein
MIFPEGNKKLLIFSKRADDTKFEEWLMNESLYASHKPAQVALFFF